MVAVFSPETLSGTKRGSIKGVTEKRLWFHIPHSVLAPLSVCTQTPGLKYKADSSSTSQSCFAQSMHLCWVFLFA